MDRTVPAADVEACREWPASPSISTADSPEIVITPNLAGRLGLHPTRVRGSLRKHRGYLAADKDAVAAAVAADSDPVFRRAADSRSVDFASARRGWRTKRRPAADR